jgi:hypothetical protein
MKFISGGYKPDVKFYNHLDQEDSYVSEKSVVNYYSSSFSFL